MNALILIAIVALLTARRGTDDALTPAELWHLARAYGWWAVPLGAGRLLCAAGLVIGWSIAALALLAVRPASRILLAAAVVLAAIANHISALYPPVPARQEAG